MSETAWAGASCCVDLRCPVMRHDSQAGDARRHDRDTGHEVMVAMPVGSSVAWCYADDRYL